MPKSILTDDDLHALAVALDKSRTKEVKVDRALYLKLLEDNRRLQRVPRAAERFQVAVPEGGL